MNNKKIKDTVTLLGTILTTGFILYVGFNGGGQTEAQVVQNDGYVHDGNYTYTMPMNDKIYDTETVENAINDDVLSDTSEVAKGDTLYSIARKYDISPLNLMKINKCGKCNNLKVGDIINIR